MIRTGTTSIIDHFSHRPAVTGEALDAVAGAFTESGSRCARSGSGATRTSTALPAG
jgi:hypothetical protein